MRNGNDAKRGIIYRTYIDEKYMVTRYKIMAFFIQVRGKSGRNVVTGEEVPGKFVRSLTDSFKTMEDAVALAKKMYNEQSWQVVDESGKVVASKIGETISDELQLAGKRRGVGRRRTMRSKRINKRRYTKRRQ